MIPLPQPRKTQLCECMTMLTLEREFNAGKCSVCLRREARKQATNSFYERWFNFSKHRETA